MKSLIVSANSRLTNGQNMLYLLICEKLKCDEAMTAEEAVFMWTTRVCRTLQDGVPHWTDFWHHKNEHGNWVPGLRPMSEEEIRYRAISWLMQATGALVLKGYLKVLPAIEL